MSHAPKMFSQHMSRRQHELRAKRMGIEPHGRGVSMRRTRPVTPADRGEYGMQETENE